MYKLVLDSINEELMVINLADYSIVSANRALLTALKLKLEDIVGKSCYEITHNLSEPCDSSNESCPLNEMLRTGRPVTIEHTHNDKKGNELFSEIYVSPLRDNEGQITHAIHISRDVTSRRQTDDKIQMQNAILEGINRVFQKALSAHNQEELGQICLSVAEELTQSKFGFIAELKEDTLEDIAISNPGWDVCNMIDKSGHRKKPTTLKVHGIYGRVIKDGQSLFTNDPSTHADSIGVPEGHPALKALLSVPLKSNGKIIGLICVGNREGGYLPKQLHILEALAPAIVEAIMRKRTEHAIKQSEARLKEAQRIAQIGDWDLDLEHNVLVWSDEIYHIFETNPNNFKPSYEEFLNTVHPADRLLVDRVYRDSLENKVPYEAAHRLLLADGQIKFVNERGKTIYDANGKALRSIGTVQDITERKKAEEALLLSEEKYRELINNMNETIWVIDLNGNFIDVNDAAVNVLGYSREEMLRMGPPDIDNSYTQTQVRDLIAILPLDKKHVFETVHTTKDGKKIPVEISSKYITYQGKQAILSIARDISERRQLEARLRGFAYQLNGLSAGGSYLCESHERAFKAYADLTFYSLPGLCIVRDDPEKLMHEYGVKSADLRLLAAKPIKGFQALTDLQGVSLAISEFLKANSGGVVLLDGLEYLVSIFGFDSVYRFIQEKRFDFLEGGALLLVPLDMATLSEREKALLMSELKLLTEKQNR